MEDSLKDIVRANWWETATVTTVYEKLDKGANINARSNDGMTPLMYASKVSSGNDVVVFLIKNGAKITDIDDHNYTAIDYAKDNKNLSEKLKKTMQKLFASKQKQITISEDEIIADCKQAKEKVIARFNELGGENITLFAKTKVVDFSSNGVFLERNCLNVNQKWIFPELKQQFKNCKQSERVFLYTSDTEYLNDEYFKDENYLYYRDGVLKYTTIIGSTNSVPAFKRSNYRIDELYYKKYLNNRNINCD